MAEFNLAAVKTVEKPFHATLWQLNQLAAFCLHFAIKSGFSLLLMAPNNTELQLVPQTLFLQHFLYGGRHVLTNQHSVSFLNIICPSMARPTFGKHYSRLSTICHVKRSLLQILALLVNIILNTPAKIIALFKYSFCKELLNFSCSR